MVTTYDNCLIIASGNANQRIAIVMPLKLGLIKGEHSFKLSANFRDH